jgi:hypothetical protein
VGRPGIAPGSRHCDGRVFLLDDQPMGPAAESAPALLRYERSVPLAAPSRQMVALEGLAPSIGGV